MTICVNSVIKFVSTNDVVGYNDEPGLIDVVDDALKLGDAPDISTKSHE